jgi:hypothetical protein
VRVAIVLRRGINVESRWHAVSSGPDDDGWCVPSRLKDDETDSKAGNACYCKARHAPYLSYQLQADRWSALPRLYLGESWRRILMEITSKVDDHTPSMPVLVGAAAASSPRRI